MADHLRVKEEEQDFKFSGAIAAAKNVAEQTEYAAYCRMYDMDTKLASMVKTKAFPIQKSVDPNGEDADQASHSDDQKQSQSTVKGKEPSAKRPRK